MKNFKKNKDSLIEYTLLEKKVDPNEERAIQKQELRPKILKYLKNKPASKKELVKELGSDPKVTNAVLNDLSEKEKILDVNYIDDDYVYSLLDTPENIDDEDSDSNTSTNTSNNEEETVDDESKVLDYIEKNFNRENYPFSRFDIKKAFDDLDSEEILSILGGLEKSGKLNKLNRTEYQYNIKNKENSEENTDNEEDSELRGGDTLKYIEMGGEEGFDKLSNHLEGKTFPEKKPDQYNLIYKAIYKCRENDELAYKFTKLLHDHGESFDSGREWGFSPIFVAAKYGLVKTFKYLLDNGAKLDSTPIVSNSGGIVSTTNLVKELNKCKDPEAKKQITQLLKSSSAFNDATYKTNAFEQKVKTINSNVKSNVNSSKTVIDETNNYINDFVSVFKYINDLDSINKDNLGEIYEKVVNLKKSLPKGEKDFIFQLIYLLLKSENALPDKMKNLDTITKGSKAIEDIFNDLVNKKFNMLNSLFESLSYIGESFNLYKNILLNRTILKEEYEDTAYYKKNKDAAAQALEDQMPDQGMTVAEYILEEITNPSSRFIPANDDRLDNVDDFISAVIYKIFMIYSNKKPKIFEDLFDDIVENYGDSTRQGKERKLTGVIYSAAFAGKDIFKDNVLTKNSSYSDTINRIYKSIIDKYDIDFE